MAIPIQLDETAIPGTVHLVDLEGTLRAKHASGRNADVVLVPAPSNDPDDPLNWTPRRKLISTLSLSTYTLVRHSQTRKSWKCALTFYLIDGRNCFSGDLLHLDSDIRRYWLDARRFGKLTWFSPCSGTAD
jgi:hypothetical protein